MGIASRIWRRCATRACRLVRAGGYSLSMTPITTTAELAVFCDKLKGQPFVAVDTEFMRETTYWPKLCLIQAAAPHGAEACIDPLADGIDLEPFLAILRD